MRMVRSIAVLACVLLGVNLAEATPFSFYGNTVDIEYWSGEGSGAENRAVFVLDFENATGSFAFGYGWNGTNAVMAIDLMNAVDGAGSFAMTSHVDPTFNSTLIDTLSYAGDTIGDEPYPNDYPYSFMSANGVDWNELFTGVDDTPVGDGDYLGWSAQSEGWTEVEPGVWVPPDYNTPNTPVPEPGSLGLLSLGAVLVAWHRKRVG